MTTPDMARAEQELSGMEDPKLAAMDVDSDHSTGDLIAPKGKLTQTGLEYATRAARGEIFTRAMYELPNSLKLPGSARR